MSVWKQAGKNNARRILVESSCPEPGKFSSHGASAIDYEYDDEHEERARRTNAKEKRR
jgi:hypothetical protein